MRRPRNGASDTHLPDPTQLPIVDVAHQTEDRTAPASQGQTGRFKDPRVMDWGEKQGPRLNGICRAVFEKICEFVNPGTGEAFPSQETLAEALDVTRVTVNRAIQEILRVRPVMMTARKVPRPDGKFTYNRYRMAGLEAEWQLTVPKGEKSVVLSAAQRHIRTEEKLLKALRMLEELGIEHGIEHDIEDFPSEDSLASESGTDTRERETDSVRVSDLYTVYTEDGEAVSLSETPVAVAETHTEPPTDPVSEFVDENAAFLLDNGWDHAGGAEKVFRANPREFARWQEKVAEAKAGADPRDRYLEAYEGWTGKPGGGGRGSEAQGSEGGSTEEQAETGEYAAFIGPQDPRPAEVWSAVLGELQLQVPKPMFETWLRRTSGVFMGREVFIAGAPTPFAVEWLERRMFHAIQTVVHKVTREPLEIQFRVVGSWGMAAQGDDADP